MNFWIYYAILIILLLSSVIISVQLYAYNDYHEHGLFINVHYPKIVTTQEISPNIKIFDIDGLGYLDRTHTVRDVNVTITIGNESVSGKTNAYGFYSGAIDIWKNGYYHGTITAEKGDMITILDIEFRAEKYAQGGSTNHPNVKGGSGGDQGEDEGGDEQ